MTKTLKLILRDAEWLSGERIGRIALSFVILLPVALGIEFWLHLHPAFALVHATRSVSFPLGEDFVNFWAGAKLAMAGHAAIVYDIAAFQRFEHAHTLFWQFRWYAYPPVALLLSAPLALFPYLAGYGFWIASGAGLCAYLFSRSLRWPAALLATFASPAFFFNVVSGQNGCFTAALMAGGLLLLERRPAVAGILFGLLCYKPQMAVLLPFALIAAGHWKTVFAAALTVAAIVGLSVVAFGWDTWAAYLKVAPLNATILEIGTLPSIQHNLHPFWHRTPTVFAAFRLAGASIAIAYGAQAVSALAALVATVAVWRGGASQPVKSAALILATFAATPYAWDYDLPIVTFAIVWLWIEAARSGFLPWERLVFAGALASTLVIGSLARVTAVQVGPVLFWLTLAFATARALGWRQFPVAAKFPASETG